MRKALVFWWVLSAAKRSWELPLPASHYSCICGARRRVAVRLIVHMQVSCGHSKFEVCYLYGCSSLWFT